MFHPNTNPFTKGRLRNLITKQTFCQGDQAKRKVVKSKKTIKKQVIYGFLSFTKISEKVVLRLCHMVASITFTHLLILRRLRVLIQSKEGVKIIHREPKKKGQ